MMQLALFQRPGRPAKPPMAPAKPRHVLPGKAERLERHAARMRGYPEALRVAAARALTRSQWAAMTPEQRTARTRRRA